jgi:ubiquinone/menaquinone biosynthesis C-methylase UbiE
VDFRGKHARLEGWGSYDSPVKQEYGRFILELLNTVGCDWVLDDGCGNGRFTEALSGKGSQIVALDISEPLTKIAKGRCTGNSVHIIRGDMTHLPFRTSTFDRVLCVHNLWYVKKFEEAIAEMGRVLKSGGKCVVDQLNLFDLSRLTDWKFYGQVLKSLLGKAFIDMGRSCSSFVSPFEKMQYSLFSVNVKPKLEVTKGGRSFANRFLVSATKAD